MDLTIQSNAFIVQPPRLRRIELQLNRVVVVEDVAFLGIYMLLYSLPYLYNNKRFLFNYKCRFVIIYTR